MSAVGTVKLSGIAYELGDRCPVLDLVGDGITIDDVSELLERGVSGVAVLKQPLVEALSRCIERTLSSSGVPADDIDTVIVATESFATFFESDVRPDTDIFRLTRDRTFALFHDLGFHRATIQCTTYGGCTNFLQALVTAEALVLKGLSRNVLVVAAEKLGSSRSRFMNEAISLAGDGAAACLISARKDSGSGIFALKHVSAAPYKKYDINGDMAKLLLEMFRAIKSAAADCYDACNWQPSDFRWIILGDYNRPTSMTYGKLLGFPPERIFLKNVGQFGHIPFDPLINLADLSGEGLLSSIDKIFMFLCGPVSCGSVALEAE
ncbi:UNVERIFIED_ORG: hypothetical protein BTE55_09820 [Rhizobium sophorae]